jgi:methylmalonyl-CoA mutase N-terminal domain/subunit
VNAYRSEEPPIAILQIDRAAADHQIRKLEALRTRRSAARVEQTLAALKRGAEREENTMPLILDAVRAYATVGEICGALKDVFGSYTEAALV